MKDVPIGKLKTTVVFKSVTHGNNVNGVLTESVSTILTARCHWQNAHGTETVENLRLNLGELATISMRYSALVDVKQLVYLGSEVWEIVSIDNVEERNRWMEIKVKRKVKA